MELSSPDIDAVRTAAMQFGANGAEELPALLDRPVEGSRSDGAITTLPEVTAMPRSYGPERRTRLTVVRAVSSPIVAGKSSRSRSRDRTEDQSQQWMREMCAV